MPDNISLELILILAIGIPSALVGLLQFMISRYGSGSKALAVAVQAQENMNAEYQTIRTDMRRMESTYAEERGGLKQQVSSLELELIKEREHGEKLARDILQQDHKHQTDLADLKRESDAKMVALSDALETLKRQVSDLSGRLERAEEEKQVLADAKVAAEVAFEEEKRTLEGRVNAMLDVQDKIQRDMVTMKRQYEERITELNLKIAQKDDEIGQLKKVLEDKDAKSIQDVDVGGDTVDGGVAVDGGGDT